MDVSSDDESWCKPLEVFINTDTNTVNILPEKSKKIYTNVYDTFREWQKSQGINSFAEDIILSYFENLATKFKPPTLWAQFSMLKSTININDNVDIGMYRKVISFIKQQRIGYTSEKTKTFTAEEIEKFVAQAPDRIYLATKVACIFGVTGACRSVELLLIKVNDVKPQGRLFQVNVRDTANNKKRTFVVPEDFHDIIKKYADLRPKSALTDRFFINYQHGKCTVQNIGVNKFGSFPKQIAEFLNLPDPNLYKAHCFRQTSKELTSTSGADIKKIKYHGRWKSREESEDDVKDPINVEMEIGKLIAESMSVPPSPSTSNSESEMPRPKRMNKNGGVESDARVTTAKFDSTSSDFQWSPLENVSLKFINCTNHISIYLNK